MSTYYCLVAGLPDITLDDTKLTLTTAQFREEAYPQLSTEDRKLFDLFFLQYDNNNLLKFLKNKETQLDPRGTLTATDLDEMVQEMKESDAPKNKRIIPYFPPFVAAYLQDKPLSEGVLWEDQLSGLYYNYATQTSNAFARDWFTFNLNLNNLLIGFAARKFHFEAATAIVGDNDVATAIRNSNTRDFGLTGTVDYLEPIQRIAEDGDLYDRERKIDLLRWQWIEEHTFFEYFTVEKLFAYLIKTEIIERWLQMNPTQGEIKFREALEALKHEVEIPTEFSTQK